MVFFFAEIMESGHINLLKTKGLEGRKTLCQENITLMIGELEFCCEHLQAQKHSKFYLCKTDILTAPTEIKPAKVIYAFSASASLLVWKLLKLLPPLLLKWEWGNTNNFLYCSHGETEVFLKTYCCVFLVFGFFFLNTNLIDKNKTKN